MNAPPIWLLDIDGVINALPDKRSPRYHGFEYAEVGAFGHGIVVLYQIHYRTVVVDLVNRIHRDRLAEVRWLTTWVVHARDRFAPQVGLDRFAVAAEPPESGLARRPWSPERWRLAVIREQAGARYVFTDDDLRRPSRAHLRSLPGKGLLVTPAANVGLNDGHLGRISAFLAPTTPEPLPAG